MLQWQEGVQARCLIMTGLIGESTLKWSRDTVQHSSGRRMRCGTGGSSLLLTDSADLPADGHTQQTGLAQMQHW